MRVVEIVALLAVLIGVVLAHALEGHPLAALGVAAMLCLIFVLIVLVQQERES